MLQELKFVQGSIAKKDYIPALTHFVIENGTVRGYNGMIALCSPIPFDIECKPKANELVKAIATCTETVQLSLTTAGRLSIRSGKFKAFIDCLPDEVTPHVHPEGTTVVIDGKILLEALKAVHPFVGNDASRPWSNGVLLVGQSAYATNNITMIEYWTGYNVPNPINIPGAAIKELLRIGEPPTSVQMTESSISFHFTGERWLRAQLFDTKWPDLTKVLNCESNPKPIDGELFEALKTIKQFTDKEGRIIFGENKIMTHPDESEGASYNIEGFNFTGTYQIDMLSLLNGTAKTIDWNSYPSPCMFFGDRLRGAIVGMRQ